MSTSRPHGRRARQSGQILPLMMGMVVVLLLLAAIPVDGGFDMVLFRQTQNAADAAAQAVAGALTEPCFNNTDSSFQHQRTIPTIIQQVVADNIPGRSSASTPTWKARYLHSDGSAFGASFDSPGDPAAIPPIGACGVTLSVGSTRSTNLATLFGVSSLSTAANAAAKLSWTGGVVALAQYGRHTFNAKSFGQLGIDGDLRLLSLGCRWVANSAPLRQPDAYRHYPSAAVTDSNGTGDQCAPGTGASGFRHIYSPGLGQGPISCDVSTPACWGEDTMDTFEDGQLVSLDFRGYIYSASQYPLDSFFYCASASGSQRMHTSSSSPIVAWAVHGANLPCSSSGAGMNKENIIFNGIIPAGNSLKDPLSGISPPTAPAHDYCSSGAVYTSLGQASSPGAGGVVHLHPGTYKFPVVIGYDHSQGFLNNDFVFDACPGNNNYSYPGIYDFEQGVEICPGSSHSVTSGSAGVMLYSGGPFGGPGPKSQRVYGCPGEGKSTPFRDDKPPGDPMRFCPGSATPTQCYENDDQVLDAGYYGSGTYGITIGGHGKVTLTAPTSGPYKGILLFQDRADGKGVNGPNSDDTSSPSRANGTSLNEYGANIGLDPYPGARYDRPGYDPNSPSAQPYHDNLHDPPGLSANDPRASDNADIKLTGIIYDAYKPLTGPGATQLPKLDCTGQRDPTVPPGFCYLRYTGDGVAHLDDPTPGASLQPAALYPNGSANPFIPTSCGQVPAGSRHLCQTQLDKANLWRVICSGPGSTPNAGRIQIGQSTCSNDIQEASTFGGNVTITGAAIADVFSTSGGINANIDVQSTPRVESILAPPPT